MIRGLLSDSYQRSEDKSTHAQQVRSKTVGGHLPNSLQPNTRNRRRGEPPTSLLPSTPHTHTHARQKKEKGIVCTHVREQERGGFFPVLVVAHLQGRCFRRVDGDGHAEGVALLCVLMFGGKMRR